jgi:serine/threonine protein phosphatase PrpC
LEHTDYLLAGGSVVGREHRHINAQKNNQDGYFISRTTTSTIAIVADGCGSGQFSEVGALLGARLITEAMQRDVESYGLGRLSLRRITQEVLGSISLLARQMGDNYTTTIEQYFLFTVMGAILAENQAIFFGLGDGVICINSELTQIGPFPGNQPPYLSYGLLRDQVEGLKEFARLPLDSLENFLIGSDGVIDLVATQDRCLPGLDEAVGSISQFWQPKFVQDGRPDLLARRLRLIARDWPKHNPDPGLLSDDTTMIVGRKADKEEL